MGKKLKKIKINKFWKSIFSNKPLMFLVAILVLVAIFSNSSVRAFLRMPSQAAEIIPGTLPSKSISCTFYASSLGNDQNNGSAPQSQYAVRTIRKAIDLSKANCPVSAMIKLVGGDYEVSNLDLMNPILVNGETKNIIITSSGIDKTHVMVGLHTNESLIAFFNMNNFTPNGTITVKNLWLDNVGLNLLTNSYSLDITRNFLTNQTNHALNDDNRLVAGALANADASNIKIYDNEFVFAETTAGGINNGIYADNLSWNTQLDIYGNTFNYFSYPNQYSSESTYEVLFIGIRLHQNNSQALITNNRFITKGVSIVGKSITSANIHNFGIILDNSVIKTVVDNNYFSKFNGIDVSAISPPVQGGEFQNIVIHNNIGI